jgi:NifU-like protein involved in Fe-S cluster formation
MNYSDLTLRYFETAAGAGILTGSDVYRGAAGSRASGTWVQFDLEVRAGDILAARFLAFGCPHTIAAASWIVEQAAGPIARAALRESVESLSARFDVPVDKRGRLLIIEDAWTAGLRQAGLQA